VQDLEMDLSHTRILQFGLHYYKTFDIEFRYWNMGKPELKKRMIQQEKELTRVLQLSSQNIERN